MGEIVATDVICLTAAFDSIHTEETTCMCSRQGSSSLWWGSGADGNRGTRPGTPPVNAVVRETIMERQVHFQSSD